MTEGAQAIPPQVVGTAPAEPPALLPGPSAHRLFNRWMATSAVLVAATLLLLAIAPGIGVDGWGQDALILGAGLAALAVVMLRLGRVGDRKLEEIHAGYTTLTLEFGLFWFGENRRWPRSGHRAPWDYAGLWVLDGASGAVLSEPDRRAVPPGMYPSPNRPGAMELWTGAVWSGHYGPDCRPG